MTEFGHRQDRDLSQPNVDFLTCHLLNNYMSRRRKGSHQKQPTDKLPRPLRRGGQTPLCINANAKTFSLADNIVYVYLAFDRIAFLASHLPATGYTCEARHGL